MKTTRLLFAAASLAAVGLNVRADVDIALTADIRLGRAVAPPPPHIEIVDIAVPPGTPPWERRSWFHHERLYYFYPEAAVYYRPVDRMWFYLDGGVWRFGIELPASITLDLGHCVGVTMWTDRPFDHHRDVIRYYPPAYFRHVRVQAPPPERDRPRGHEGDRGRDHRKGHDRDR